MFNSSSQQAGSAGLPFPLWGALVNCVCGIAVNMHSCLLGSHSRASSQSLLAAVNMLHVCLVHPVLCALGLGISCVV